MTDTSPVMVDEVTVERFGTITVAKARDHSIAFFDEDYDWSKETAQELFVKYFNDTKNPISCKDVVADKKFGLLPLCGTGKTFAPVLIR